MSRVIELRRRFFARAAWWLVITFGAFILIAVLSVHLREAVLRRMEEQVKLNLNEIQAALDEWFEDHGSYPAQIDTLIQDGCLTQFPTNPFTGEPMAHIDIGQPSKPGGFTYYAQPLDETITSALEYGGYCLVAYGRRRTGPRTPLEAFGAFPELDIDGNQVIVRYASSIKPNSGGFQPAGISPVGLASSQPSCDNGEGERFRSILAYSLLQNPPYAEYT